MPAALCFDAFGTLYDPESPAVWLRERVQAPAGVVDDVVSLWRTKQLQYSYLVALMEAYRPFDEVTYAALEYALEYYGLDVSESDREAIASAYRVLETYPDVPPALDRLADSDTALAVLSNGDPQTLESIASSAGITDRFSTVISADEVGTFKPSPSVYQRAANRLDVPISDCWLVSSNAWDVVGASNAGMGAAWVNRTDAPKERIGDSPTLIVDSLTALADELL